MTTHFDAVNAAHYTDRVSWSAEDGEFVATCLELPSLSWLESTQVKALSGIRKLVDDVLADLVASGEDRLVPLAGTTLAASVSASHPICIANSPPGLPTVR